MCFSSFSLVSILIYKYLIKQFRILHKISDFDYNIGNIHSYRNNIKPEIQTSYPFLLSIPINYVL